MMGMRMNVRMMKKMRTSNDFEVKNEEVVQDGNTNTMLWKIDELISYVSQYFTLKKGDIIFTGTPAGVGKVSENDVLVGKIQDEKAFEIRVK